MYRWQSAYHSKRAMHAYGAEILGTEAATVKGNTRVSTVWNSLTNTQQVALAWKFWFSSTHICRAWSLLPQPFVVGALSMCEVHIGSVSFNSEPFCTLPRPVTSSPYLPEFCTRADVDVHGGCSCCMVPST